MTSRRRGVERGEDRRQVVRGRARRSRAAGRRRSGGRGPGRSTTMTGAARRRRSRGRPSSRRAGEAVEQQHGRPAPRPDLPAEAVDVDARSPAAGGAPATRGGAPRGAAPRCAPAPCAARGRWTPGRPIDARERGREVARARRRVLAAERRHDRPDVDPVGRPEQLLVVLGQARPGPSVRAWGRNEKMPPPSLLTSTIVADRPWSRAATSALRSWRNDRSPTTSTTGPSATAADPSAVDTTPSMPFAPRFDSGRDRPVGRRQPAVEVADRHRVAGPQQRRRRAATSPSAANGAPSNGSSRARQPAGHRRGAAAARSASQPVARPAPARRASAAARAQRPARGRSASRRRGRTSSGISAGSRQPPSPSTTI